MKRFFFHLWPALLLFAGCKQKESDLESKAARIIEKECDCFTTAGISFNKKIQNVLEEGVGRDSAASLGTYDSLDYESIKELKKFIAAVYDSTNGLGRCLKKIVKEEENGLSDKELNELAAKKGDAAMKNTVCRLVVYYETGAIASASHTSENKKADTSFSGALPDSIPLRVVIIRHGEKPEKGLNLTCTGYNRSLALPDVIVSLFGVPEYIYVPIIRVGKTTNSVRMYQTIVPFVVQHKLVVNSRHAETDSSGIAEDILKKQGTVLIVWNSTDMPAIARNLGIKKGNLTWNPVDYDTIWVIDYTRTKKGKLKPRMINTRENIDPSDECK